MLYIPLIALSFFFLGLLVGSFLNAIIYRLPAPHRREKGLRSAKSILSGRSCCPNCGKTLSWHELIPVLSFIIQAGKCLGCKKPISLQYPIVELMTGVLFLFVIFNFQFSIFNQLSIFQFSKIVFLWTILSGLIVIFVFDFKHYIIPDKILFPLIILTSSAIILRVWIPDNMGLEIIPTLPGIYDIFSNGKNLSNLLNALGVGFLAAGPFAFLHYVSRGGWMGFGDVKLAFFVGLLLGLPGAILALFISFNAGAAVGVTLIFTGKKNLKNQIQFGPFLVFGTIVTLFWGTGIINRYLNLLF